MTGLVALLALRWQQERPGAWGWEREEEGAMFRSGLKWVLPGQGCETTGLRTLDLFSSSYS